MTEVFTFNESGMKKVAEAVTRLHVQTEHITGEVARIQRRVAGVPTQSSKPQVRTGITSTTPDEPTYPTNEKSCLFPFHVHDLNFDVANVDQDCVATTGREWTGVYHTGRTIDGSYLPEGTPILFVEIPNATGKQFWILPAVEPPDVANEARWFIVRESFNPYAKNQKAALAFYNTSSDTWEDDFSDPVGIYFLHDDGGTNCGLVDELVFAHPRPFDATHNPDGKQYDLVAEHGLKRKGKVNGGDVNCGAVGNLEVWRDPTLADCAGEKVTPEFLLPFCNTGLGYHRRLYGPQTAGSPAVQDELWAEWDGYNWYIVRDTKAHSAVADVDDAFCGDSLLGVSAIRYRDWQPSCLTDDPNIDDVDNSPHRLTGEAGSRVNLIWNEESVGNKATVWTVVQAEHTTENVLVAIENVAQSECPDKEYRRTNVTVMKSDACPIPDPVVFLEYERQDFVKQMRYAPGNCSFYEQQASACWPKGTINFYPEERLNLGESLTVATGVDKFSTGDPLDTCGLQVNTVIICSLNPVTPGPQPPSIDFIKRPTIEDISDEIDGLHGDFAEHFVLCNNPPVDTLIVPYTDCDDEGGNEDID